MRLLFHRLFQAALIPSLLQVLYLDLLSVAALIGARPPQPTARGRRFCILIPAHNEFLLLPDLLKSLHAVDYPADQIDVHVVADNCTDATADVAREMGATAHERHDRDATGKGHALRWLLGRLEMDRYDAFVFVDADSVVEPNLLDVLDRHLERGEDVLQCRYMVSNSADSRSAALRFLGFALFNDLRPLGRERLGLSVGLRGNGMCFSRNVLARMGWTAFTLAEDAELHMQLVDTGHVVHYAPETSVTSRMPTTLAGAQTQNARWERGRLLLLRRYWRPFLAASLRRRDARHLDAIAEQAIPPLSVLVGVSVLYWAVSLAIRSPGRVWAASLLLLGEAFYVGCGLRISRAPSHVYAALLSAPLYVLWKGHLYARALVARGAKTWIRTPRGDETISPDRSI
ncbi:MAG TPA: glycosyltransferase family 2 protein [Chloroflexota bacterium]|nr:glycosyltransferase family 2 protein [Chloroflexota bacterium]